MCHTGLRSSTRFGGLDHTARAALAVAVFALGAGCGTAVVPGDDQTTVDIAQGGPMNTPDVIVAAGVYEPTTGLVATATVDWRDRATHAVCYATLPGSDVQVWCYVDEYTDEGRWVTVAGMDQGVGHDSRTGDLYAARCVSRHEFRAITYARARNGVDGAWGPWVQFTGNPENAGLDCD